MQQEKQLGGWRVLVVDDDDLLRQTVRMMLEALGHKALAAADGQRALELYGRYRDCIVLLDISMEGMDGHACMHALRQIDPEVRVILSSGYLLEEEALRVVPQQRHLYYLQKPYTPEALQRVLHQAMAGR